MKRIQNIQPQNKNCVTTMLLKISLPMFERLLNLHLVAFSAHKSNLALNSVVAITLLYALSHSHYSMLSVCFSLIK